MTTTKTILNNTSRSGQGISPPDYELQLCCQALTGTLPANISASMKSENSGFIFGVRSYSECAKRAIEHNIDIRIALARWFYHMVKQRCAELFVECDPESVRLPAADENRNKSDISINGIPFMLRINTFSEMFGKNNPDAQLFRNPDHLSKAAKHIKDLYADYRIKKLHGYTDRRVGEKAMPQINIINLICDANDYESEYRLMCDFLRIKESIKAKLEEYRRTLPDSGIRENSGFFDIIYINSEKEV